MGESFVIDTATNTVKAPVGATAVLPGSTDPFNHLPPAEWVQKQIDWGVDHISGSGLIDPLKSIVPVIGAEIGTCLGVTAELFLKELPSIQKLFCVDHYPSFIDWNGTIMSEERQACMKEHATQRLAAYGDRVAFRYQTSEEFHKWFQVQSAYQYLDFIFIDGDHSFDGVLRDFTMFWDHIRPGGIFAGHDWNISSVQQAIRQFFPDITKVQQVANEGWFIIKES